MCVFFHPFFYHPLAFFQSSWIFPLESNSSDSNKTWYVATEKPGEMSETINF